MEKPERQTSPQRVPSNIYTEELIGGPSGSHVYRNWRMGQTTGVRPEQHYADEGERRDDADDYNFSRKSLYMIAALVVTLLILIAVAVTLGVILTRSDHPCSACDCETSILMGQITDTYNFPMSGATISHADRPNTTLAVSDMQGRFRITGICATPQKLSVTNNLFTREEQMTTCSAHKAENCTSYFNAQLRRLELPFITANPRSKLRVKGQNVAFCCSAEGVPSPNKYEWLKDGTLITTAPTNGDSLILKTLSEADSGRYACRVRNVAGTVLSDSAKLTVTATPVDCDPEPTSRIIQLPEDCIQPGTNTAEYDVGTCDNKPCAGKLKDQTLYEDLNSESYCCQAQERKTANIYCQGYTFPVQTVTSCGCSQCAPKSIQVSGRVVSADTVDNLDSIVVYYKEKNVTETDNTGRFLFSTHDAVSRVSLTFRDDNYHRVWDTTIVFQVTEESALYGVIKMIPVTEGTPSDVDGQVDNTFSILDSPNDDPLGSIILAANTQVSEDSEIYNGTVRVTVNNIDMRSRKGASLAPGDATTVDDDGYKVSLRLFGVFSFAFSDPTGQSLFVTGHSQFHLTNPTLLHLCQGQSGDNCDIMLWVLNTKTGTWEKISLFKVTNAESRSRRKKRQDSEVVVANLVLRDYEWYSIAVIDDKDGCWAKVIGYSNEMFSPNAVLPFIYQVISVLEEIQRSEQDPDDSSMTIFRISQPSSVTENGRVGVCVPLACPKDTSATQVEAFLSVTLDDKYMKPADPKDVIYQDVVKYFIANHNNRDTQPQIWLRRLVADPMGPIYPGRDAGGVDGVCTSAGTENNHFQFYCANCNDVICNTFHSIAESPADLQLQTFYTNIPPDKQSYCFIGLQIRSSSLSVRVIITSESYEGLFYGRREVILRKPNADDDFVEACMEFKCSGQVFDGINSQDHDVTRVTVDVSDKDSTTCLVQTEAPDFTLGQTQLPFTFDDPRTYGLRTGIHTKQLNPSESICTNDKESPQTTNTEHCQINDNFVYAALITCS